MTDRQKILEKVRKLSEITNPDSGAFPGEIANASALMQKLMDEYSISIGEVLEGQNQKYDEAFGSANADLMLGLVKSWHWQLAQIISRITHTRHYSTGTYVPDGKRTSFGDKRTRGRTIAFYGPGSSAEMAADLYVEWVSKMTIMVLLATSEYCKGLIEVYNKTYPHRSPIKSAYKIQFLGDDHPNVFRNSWLMGCLSEISSSLYQQEKARSAGTSSALMIVEKQIDEKWKDYSKHFSSAAPSERMINSQGYSSGKEAGASIHIGQKSMGGANKQLHD